MHSLPENYTFTMPCSATYFQEVGARVLFKVATKGSPRDKKLWKFRFLGCFSKAKTEECNQNVWNVFDQFGIIIPCTATYFLEVGARVSLKVVTKESPRGQTLWKFRFSGCFSKAKTEDCDLSNRNFLNKCASIYKIFETNSSFYLK